MHSIIKMLLKAYDDKPAKTIAFLLLLTPALIAISIMPHVPTALNYVENYEQTAAHVSSIAMNVQSMAENHKRMNHKMEKFDMRLGGVEESIAELTIDVEQIKNQAGE